MNTSLLKEKDFATLVNKCIKEEYHNYAIPVYSIDYLNTLANDIKLKIDYDLFLEVLLLRIRGEAIKYGSNKTRLKNRQQKELILEIEQLESIGLDTTKIEKKKKRPS